MCTGESSSRFVNKKKGVQFGRKRGRVPRAFPVLARWKRDVAATGADGLREKRESDDVKEGRNNNPTWRVTIGTLDPSRPY
ncbi:unnamed protein product [Sphagnum jensenii]|uniref:Uncharacterized protein n=1 Tax=Sphagnum jensenii TaxID=128206 RepID=A0ABP0WEZ4_9BRYO